MTDIPPFRCEVFAATDIGVVSGVGLGEPLLPLGQVFEGDIYQLRPDAIPRVLALDTRSAPPRVAPGAALGTSGEAIASGGRLLLMAADGQKVTLELLAPGGVLHALPLSPLRAQLDYTLIRADQGGGALRLSDMACASFVRGTRIARPGGTQTPIEDLCIGDVVLTRDNGPQPLAWIGRTSLRAEGNFAPVEFAPGVLGNADTLRLSPHHRVFLYQHGAARLADRAEVLVQAVALVDGARVRRREGGFVDYFSLVFDAHEIVYAEGTPVESLLVGKAMAPRLPPGLAEDLQRRFPGLAQHPHFAVEPEAPTDLLRARILRSPPDTGA